MYLGHRRMFLKMLIGKLQRVKSKWYQQGTTPRGDIMTRTQDGRGKGPGIPGGRGQNRNQKPCKSGPGKSQGGGKGKGKNR